MGWKSTIEKIREEALSLIREHIGNASNESLENILEELGDDKDLEYPPMYGHNFIIHGSKKCEERHA